MKDAEKTPVAAGDETPKQRPRKDSLSGPGSSAAVDGSKKEAPQVGKANEEEVPKDRFEVKKYQAVALWTWDLKTDTCAICKTHIMEICIECAARDATEACNPAWGECGHCYHFHCIARWLKTRAVCPLDNKEWVMTKIGA